MESLAVRGDLWLRGSSHAARVSTAATGLTWLVSTWSSWPVAGLAVERACRQHPPTTFDSTTDPNAWPENANQDDQLSLLGHYRGMFYT